MGAVMKRQGAGGHGQLMDATFSRFHAMAFTSFPLILHAVSTPILDGRY
jgi:hypothetical protein